MSQHTSKVVTEELDGGRGGGEKEGELDGESV